MNNLAFEIALLTGGCILDSNNILWKRQGKSFIGKRSVWTFDKKACWIEETDKSNIKIWWCGIDADYSETFKKYIA